MVSKEPTPEFDTIEFDNGDYYEGEAINRVPHGHGTMYYEDKTLECEWLYGLPVGSANPDEKIPGYGEEKYEGLITINKHTFCVGYTYLSGDIAKAFEVSSFIRGIRIHRDKAVLFSIDNSVYNDGKGWEKDEDGEYVFVYTGEGLTGDQKMTPGNLFLNNSNGKGLYLFVRRKQGEYVFYGKVDVKRKFETIEPDKDGNARKVYKFILRRHIVE